MRWLTKLGVVWGLLLISSRHVNTDQVSEYVSQNNWEMKTYCSPPKIPSQNEILCDDISSLLIVHSAIYGFYLDQSQCSIGVPDCSTQLRSIVDACTYKSSCSFPSVMNLPSCGQESNYVAVNYTCLPVSIFNALNPCVDVFLTTSGEVHIMSPSFPLGPKINDPLDCSCDLITELTTPYELTMTIGQWNSRAPTCDAELKLSHRGNNVYHKCGGSVTNYKVTMTLPMTLQYKANSTREPKLWISFEVDEHINIRCGRANENVSQVVFHETTVPQSTAMGTSIFNDDVTFRPTVEIGKENNSVAHLPPTNDGTVIVSGVSTGVLVGSILAAVALTGLVAVAFRQRKQRKKKGTGTTTGLENRGENMGGNNGELNADRTDRQEDEGEVYADLNENEMEGVYVTADNGGYASADNGGYASADNGGYASPDNGGYASPDNGGYASPDNGGYASADNGAYASPDNGGYALPDDGGYEFVTTGRTPIIAHYMKPDVLKPKSPSEYTTLPVKHKGEENRISNPTEKVSGLEDYMDPIVKNSLSHGQGETGQNDEHAERLQEQVPQTAPPISPRAKYDKTTESASIQSREYENTNLLRNRSTYA